MKVLTDIIIKKLKDNIWEKKNENCLFADDLTTYWENPKSASGKKKKKKRCLELKSESNKVGGYKSQYTKINCIPIY